MKQAPFYVSSLLLAATFATPSPGESDPIEGREFLLFEEIPSVYTASKTDQAVERATAVVTVVTEEDIRRSGARTLYEVLKRVPGFFPSSQATWTLTGSRGLTSDGNDHVLLLIDGHVQNSIVGQGYQQQDMLPVLDKVHKIEIVRGPGSVLWGSSAVMGVINIITKSETTGDDDVAIGYGARDGMLSASMTRALGNELGGPSGIVSLSYWKSDGYNRPDRSDTGAAFSKEEADAVHANVEFPWGRVGDWPSIDRHKGGWEIYSRINFGDDNELLARLAESRVVYPWDTWLDNPGSELRMRKTYAVYRHRDQLGERVALESTVFGDMLLQNRFPDASELFQSGSGENRPRMQDQSNEERALGAEVSADVRFTENQHATFGIKAVHASIGPNRDARFDIAENVPASTEYPYVGVESGNDNTTAAYFEDIWDVNDKKTTLFVGSRIEYNDFREEKAVLLPRGGVIHSLTDASTVKYVFNTGYLRPNAVYSKTSGIIVDDRRGPNQDFLLVDKSESIQNHEVQWYWRTDQRYLAVNTFYMRITNYISFDANNTPQGYKNLGDAESRGIEVEGRQRLGQSWDVYTNYSFVRAELDKSQHQGALTNDDNQTLNYPSHIYNLGATWLGWDGARSLDLHLGGWSKMQIVKPLSGDGAGGQFGTLDGEYYVDLTYQHPNVFGSATDLSVFCMNVLDNTDAVGMIVNNGVWYPRGRNVGATLRYNW